jgi:GNAT superfamily N-acetyltransferase
MTTLRPETDEDLPFLLSVYAGSRAAEMELVPWSAEQKDEFIRSQFGFQRTHYRQHFPEASFDIIVVDHQPAGRLYVRRLTEAIHIVDIALLPQFRGRGLGTAMLCDLHTEAAGRGVPLSIHVERFNPALRLYGRLGFKPVGEPGEVYIYMEWGPESPGPVCTSIIVS